MPTKLASRQSGVLLVAWRASAILGFGVAVPWACFFALKQSINKPKPCEGLSILKKLFVIPLPGGPLAWLGNCFRSAFEGRTQRIDGQLARLSAGKKLGLNRPALVWLSVNPVLPARFVVNHPNWRCSPGGFRDRLCSVNPVFRLIPPAHGIVVRIGRFFSTCTRNVILKPVPIT